MMALNYQIILRLSIILSIFSLSCLWLIMLVKLFRPDIENIIMKESLLLLNDDANNHSLMSDNDNNANDNSNEERIINELKTIKLSFPNNIEELKQITHLLSLYSKHYPSYVLILFCSSYLFKQTFAIPGSVFMNLLGGAIYGPWIGLPLCCLLSASGATCCYSLSKIAGKHLIEYYFKERIENFRTKFVEKQNKEKNLFIILLSLRLFPMTPNWFLNIISPILNIPIDLFFLSVLFGLIPYNFICVQTGSILSTINSINDVVTLKTFLSLLTIAIIVTITNVFMKKYLINTENIEKSKIQSSSRQSPLSSSDYIRHLDNNNKDDHDHDHGK